MHTAFFLGSALLLIGTSMACNTATASATSIPDPALDAPLASAKGRQTAVLAGGCFWGVEAVFEHVKGVTDVKSGYSGGSAAAAEYRKVSTGKPVMPNQYESLTIHRKSRMVSFSRCSFRWPMTRLN